MPLGEDSRSVNVAIEEQDGSSILTLYKKLIALRKDHPTLVSGKLDELHVENNVFRFLRRGAEEIEVILNMTSDEITVRTQPAQVLVGTQMYRESESVTETTTLYPGEGLVLLRD